MNKVAVGRDPTFSQPGLLIPTLLLLILCYNIKVNADRQDNLVVAKAVTLGFGLWCVLFFCCYCLVFFLVNFELVWFLFPVLCSACPCRSFIPLPPEYSLCALPDLCSSSCPSSLRLSTLCAFSQLYSAHLSMMKEWSRRGPCDLFLLIIDPVFLEPANHKRKRLCLKTWSWLIFH